ncbi:hypothetical protein [Variovorax sp. PBL-H6]|uniref:hypothetical protein n=1 Tax=Variovorax sp. PBL-H6 TaxID=434009 RepID=UPI0013A56F0F|nr:hypothetical protein [Variovorax sp. PBL-H6]
MSLLGSAALAMWWDMAPEMKSEFEDWHSHEHFPERLGVPGFRRASRWTSATGDEGIFVLYELESYAVLSSDAYVSHLNTPTPWSARMMPHHRNMVRSQCHVLESSGSSAARHALTFRVSPLQDRDKDLREFFRTLCVDLVQRPGIVGAHLLRHQTPPIAETTEQRIRNSADRVADWVFVALGYEAPVLESLADADLAATALQASGAAEGAISGLYSLSHSATSEEFGQR